MAMSYRELVDQVRQRITEVTPTQLAHRLDGKPLILDIREASEYEQGAIPGSRFLPRGLLERSIARHAARPDCEIVLVCDAGARSALAARSLEEMGYTNVSSLAGGFWRWKTEGRPWEVPQTLNSDQRARYSRQLLLPEIGEAGQERLLSSKVLLVGAGGLGSAAALYLAAAGVGTIGIVDFDTVDASNLQRQILHNLERVGRLKVESASETLRLLNPDVKVESFSDRLSSHNVLEIMGGYEVVVDGTHNVLEIMGGYEVVVDGTDNFPTRYLLNDASLHLGKPVVHGSIFRFEGQATVFSPYQGPCYRCLFREPPPPELAPSCAETGVLGVLPGIIGSVEASEAIKLLLGIGQPLVGRLLSYDSLGQEFRILRLGRDPRCPACSDPDRPPKLVDYDDTCRPVGTVARVPE